MATQWAEGCQTSPRVLTQILTCPHLSVAVSLCCVWVLGRASALPGWGLTWLGWWWAGEGAGDTGTGQGSRSETWEPQSLSSRAILASVWSPGFTAPGEASLVAPKPHLSRGELWKERKLVSKKCPCYALTCLRAFYKTYLPLKPCDLLFQARPDVWSYNCGKICILKNKVSQKMTLEECSSSVSLCFWERHEPFSGQPTHCFLFEPKVHIFLIGCKICLASKHGEFSQKVQQNWTSCLLNFQALKKYHLPQFENLPCVSFLWCGTVFTKLLLLHHGVFHTGEKSWETVFKKTMASLKSWGVKSKKEVLALLRLLAAPVSPSVTHVTLPWAFSQALGRSSCGTENEG